MHNPVEMTIPIMKITYFLLVTLSAGSAWGRADTSFHFRPVGMASYEPKVTVATLALGFIDNYREQYSLPAGYFKNNTSGFVPVYARVEYGVGGHISLAGIFGYDVFQYDYSQLYTGNNGAFARYRTSSARIWSGGLAGFYHAGYLLGIGHTDPFVGLGVALNNIRYSAMPSGDTIGTVLQHTLTPYIKAGARYYINNQFSLYGDVGYDRHTVFSVGWSCRFATTTYYPDSDRDGIPDFADSCVLTRGIARFHGCPDSDGDGIPDAADSCPGQAGPAKLHGCPDSDGDGVPDYADSCPHEAGLAGLHGCPDEDGDGIPDYADSCPHEPGPAANSGCPVRELTHIPDLKDTEHIAVAPVPICFETGSTVLKKSCLPYIEKMTGEMRQNPDMEIVIDGYADITGTKRGNDRISLARALAVKKYFIRRGVDARRIVTRGHGSHSPVATNRTRSGRARNRRATIRVINEQAK